MQVKLSSMITVRAIAAAVTTLVASGAANAQSDVTLYGLIDIAAVWVDKADAKGNDSKKISKGAMGGSRWGVRAVEDLGDGLKAIVVLESGFNPDDGGMAQNGRLFGRQAFVGLQSAWGGLTVGRQYSPVYNVNKLNEPFGAYNLNEPLFLSDNYTGTPGAGNGSTRWDNSVQYAGKFGGFNLVAIAAAGEGVAGTASVGRKEGLSAGYAGSSYSVNAGWQQTRNGSGLLNHKVWTIGGHWTVIAPLKLNLSYTDHTSDTTSQTNRILAVGGTYAITPALDVVAGYYFDQQKNLDGDKSVFALLANYKLSKRTSVYITGDRGDRSGKYATNVFEQHPWPVGYDSRTTVSVGARHSF